MARIIVIGRMNRPSVAALMEGARQIGDEPVQLRPGMSPCEHDFMGARAVFVDGVKALAPRWRQYVRDRGIPLHIIELPRLRARPGSDYGATSPAFGIYAESLAYLPRRIGNVAWVAGALEQHAPEYVLVCGQKPDDTAHNMSARDMALWSASAVATARAAYALPVVYRPHPTAFGRFNIGERFGADALSNPAQETLREALTRAAGVVVWNSTAAVDAIDAGVPVAYAAPDAETYLSGYAARLGEPFRALTAHERSVFLLRNAACTWSLEQLADGTALRCLVHNGEWPEPALREVDRDMLDVRRDELALDAARREAQALGVTPPDAPPPRLSTESVAALAASTRTQAAPAPRTSAARRRRA